ncbi:autotransporter outer membrane beta-barrel domain-containing protein [Haloferula helveola]|uniref:Autotransporter outer membrane beta-barrel domain-containing protein n=2 Tax=Haloferula helveola TaxID=490095 RepID=A0ABN6GYJ4_9BACT|nr:autotransporter outer membrane beta-barrel domain-containing protein [Haloferula helveola]
MTPALYAANTWDGGGADANWSTVENWDDDSVPGSGALTFAGELQTSTVNDLGAALAYGGINFTNNGSAGQTGVFTLAGDSIVLGGNVTTTATSTPFADVISLDVALNADRIVTTNTDHDLTISGIISDDGNRQLIKNGPGVLTLSGANTFGRLNHDAGTVRAGASGSVFGDDNVNLAGGTTLDVAGNDVTIGGLETSDGSSVTLGAGTLTFGDASNRTCRSVFSGSGKIIFAGTAQHQFGTNSGSAPDNTHTGGTQVDGDGTISHRLKVYADKSLGDPNGDVIFNGGTIYVQGGGGTSMTSPSTRGFVLNNVPGSTILFQGNNDWWINGPISGDGGIILRQNPNGDTEGHLLGANSFNGPLRIQGTSGGAMRVWISNLADSPTQNGNIIFGDEYNTLNDNNSQILYFDSSATAPLTLANRAIEFEGDNDAIGYLRNDNATHAVTVSTDLVNSGTGLKSFQLYAGSAGPVNVFSGVISDGSGTVSLRKAGNGEWTLSGANTHTGGTELSAGTLIVDTVDALGAGPLTRNNGNLVLNANQTVPALYVGGFQQPNGVYTSADFGWLSGAGTLTVGSALPSFWDLDDSVAGPGDTAGVVDGTWNAGNTNWSESAAGDVATAAWTAGRIATFSAGNTATDISTVTVDGTRDIGGLTFEEGDVTLASGAAPSLVLKSDALALVQSGATGTVDAPITDDGTAWALTKGGPNTLTLGGANTYTGTTRIDGGTLIAGSATAFGSGGDVTFAGGTLSYNTAGAAGDISTPARLKNSASAILIDTNGESVTLAGDIDSTNTGGLTKVGTGTLTLSGNNSYSGNTTPGDGLLVLDGGTISNSTQVRFTVDGSSMSVTNGGTLNSSGNQTFQADDITMSIVGGNGVTSTWDLGGNDLSTSNTSHDNQQLVIDGAGFAGSAVVTGVNTLVWGRTNNNSTITITDGGQMNVSGGDVRIGNPYYNTNGGSHMTIGGGTATSTFTGNTGRDFYIGFGERTGSNNNVVTVSENGVLTNIRHMYVGHINNAQNGDNVSTANQLLVTGGSAAMNQLSVGYVQTNDRRANANGVGVTGGGQLSTGGSAYVGRANNSGSESSANTLTVSGTGSQWDANNQTVYVGYTNNATANSDNNILTVGADGSVINVDSLIVGDGSGSETGNQLVVNGNASATTVTISAGNSLTGSGTVTGAVSAAGTVAPGTSVGTLSVTGNTTITGTLAIEVDGATADLLAIDGDLDITTATLSITEPGAGATLGSYTIVTYTGTLTPGGPGPFGSEGTLPAGYTVDYNTPGQIKLVSGGAPTGFDAWKVLGSMGPVTFEGDTNGDGVKDGLAFLLGVANPDDDANGNLPTVTESGGSLILTFNCLAIADRDGSTLRVQHSSDIGVSDPWLATVDEVPDADDAVPDNGVTFVVDTVSEAPLNKVTATIDSGEAAGGKLFGRLDGQE